MGLKAKILVIGAGPTGLTAAVELARHGFTPTIIDSRQTPYTNSRAVIMHADVIRLLEPCGAGAGILHDAVNVPNIDVFRDGKHAVRLKICALKNDDFRIFGVPQDRVEQHLIDSLSKYGISIRMGDKCEAISQDDDSVTVQINGQAERYDYVIAADGVNSFVRKSLGVKFPGFTLPDRWSVADVNLTNIPDPTAAKIYILPDGHVATAVPIGENRYRITSNKADAVKMLPAGIEVEKVNTQGDFNVGVRQAEFYNIGRVFLAGDAAHCHSPVDGRGLNLGVGDVANLAKRFKNNNLDGYHTDRHTEGHSVIKMTELVRAATTCKRYHMRLLTLLVLKLTKYLWFLNRFASKLATNNSIRSNAILRRLF